MEELVQGSTGTWDFTTLYLMDFGKALSDTAVIKGRRVAYYQGRDCSSRHMISIKKMNEFD